MHVGRYCYFSSLFRTSCSRGNNNKIQKTKNSFIQPPPPKFAQQQQQPNALPFVNTAVPPPRDPAQPHAESPGHHGSATGAHSPGAARTATPAREQREPRPRRDEDEGRQLQHQQQQQHHHRTRLDLLQIPRSSSSALVEALRDKDLALERAAAAEQRAREANARAAKAEAQAAAIVEQARLESELLAQETAQRMVDFVERHRKQAEAQILMAESQATSEVRASAVDAAVKAAEIVLRAQVSGAGGNEFIVKGIDDVKRLMN